MFERDKATLLSISRKLSPQLFNYQRKFIDKVLTSFVMKDSAFHSAELAWQKGNNAITVNIITSIVLDYASKAEGKEHKFIILDDCVKENETICLLSIKSILSQNGNLKIKENDAGIEVYDKLDKCIVSIIPTPTTMPRADDLLFIMFNYSFLNSVWEVFLNELFKENREYSKIATIGNFGSSRALSKIRDKYNGTIFTRYIVNISDDVLTAKGKEFVIASALNK